MSVVIDGTNGITTPDVESSGPISGSNIAYTGTLTGGTGVVNLGSGQFYKDASGNVGIGTSSPGKKLDIVSNTSQDGIRITGSSNPRLTIIDSTNSVQFDALATDTEVVLRTDTNHPLVFSTNGTERMRIDSSGNLLVGRTSSTDIAGTTNTGFMIKNTQLQLTATGTVAYLTTASSGAQNYVSFFSQATVTGSITTNGTTTSYNTSSDYRLKHDIQPMTGALATVVLLKPVTYKWNADNSESQGFIAHELQEVVPECVTGEKDAVDADGNPVYQGIDTSFLVATLTAAIQELHQIVQAQAAELDTVKAELATLKGAQA